MLRRRTITLVVMVLLAMLIAIPTALAVNKTCSTACTGTNGRDHLTGVAGVSTSLSGLAGRDHLVDDGTEGQDNDILKGGKGNDVLRAREGDNAQGNRDTLNGGPGRDRCIGDSQDTFISCELFE